MVTVMVGATVPVSLSLSSHDVAVIATIASRAVIRLPAMERASNVVCLLIVIY